MENITEKFVIDDAVYETQLTKKFINRKPWKKDNPNEIRAYIPGVIENIYVKPGDNVEENQPLLILEAMKMKNDVVSPRNAKIKEVNVSQNENVEKNQLLITIE